jgi:hypothetical protein
LGLRRSIVDKRQRSANVPDTRSPAAGTIGALSKFLPVQMGEQCWTQVDFYWGVWPVRWHDHFSRLTDFG